MSNTLTALKTDNLTLEEKGRLGVVKNRFEKVVKNRLESIEPIDRIGYEEDDDSRFDATRGSINNFNIEVPQAFYKAFEDEDDSKLNPNSSPITKLFQNGAEVTFGALVELGKTLAGKTEIPQAFQKAFEGEDPSKLDPTKVVEDQKKRDVVIAIANANAVIENAKGQATKEDYEKMVKMSLRLGVNVESLADRLDAPHLRKEDLLRVYYIALGATEQEAEQKIAARVNTISSPARQGSNIKVSNKDIMSGENQGRTSQTLTG